MATQIAVGQALAILQATYPREITATMAEVYHTALRDLTDAQVEEATGRCVRECKFFPAPVELRKRAGIVHEPIDYDELLRKIQGLGAHNPHVGWLNPRAETVRERYGDDVATAYALAGCGRVFSDNETSRDIARQEFRKVLEEAEPGRVRAAIMAPAPVPRLAPVVAESSDGKQMQLGGWKRYFDRYVERKS